MATSNAMNTNNTYVKYEISITQNSQSVNKNTSNVTVSVRFYRTNKGYKTWGTGTVYCKINGTTYTASVTPSQYITENGIVLFSHTLNIPHNADGSKTLTCSAWIEHNAPLTSSEQSFSVDLTTIPRKSSVSASNGTLNTAQTLKVTQQASSFTHTITYECGNASGTICTKSKETSISWTPPLSLASQNTKGTQVSIKLTIETFNGSTSIGTNSATITYTIPASVKPSCTIEVTDELGYFDKYEAYVPNKSKFKIVIGATTSYGAGIVSYSASADGTAYSGSTIVTNVVKSSGELTITATVKDERGRTASASAKVNVLAYNAPSISLLNVHRCDADGTENAQGEYVVASFTALVTALNDKNSAQYVLEYKKSTDATYTAVALSDYAGNYNPTNGTYIFEADTGSTYDVRLTASDDFEGVIRSTSVSTGFAIMHWLASGLGMAFGKIAEFADYLDVAWNARFRKNVEVDGDAQFAKSVEVYGKLTVNEMGQPILLKDTDLNTLLTPNIYIGGSTTANTYKSLPENITSDITFLLEVMASGNNGQRMQRFTVCDKTAMVMYIRFYYSGAWGSWNRLGSNKSNLLLVEDKNVTANFSSGYTSAEVSIAKSGYTALGVVGYDALTTYVSIVRARIDNNTLKYTARHITNQSASGEVTASGLLHFKILYVANN